MKDTPIKVSPVPSLPSRSKFGLKKEKMAAKKVKEHKTPIMKVGRGKKLSKVNKKAKLNKDSLEPTVKRKRGRPRNEDRLHIKKPAKEQKSANNMEDGKATIRKRKLKSVSKFDSVSPLLKKPKISDNNCNVNGDIKMSVDSNHKPFVQKSESDIIVDPSSANVVNSNGALHCNKSLVFGNKKAPINFLKSATFHPDPPITPKKELSNGTNSLSPFRFQPTKNKNSFKKDIETNCVSKDHEMNSKFEKPNSLPSTSKEQRETVFNDFEKCNTKDIKFPSKEIMKTAIKESVKGKDFTKSQVKEPTKIQLKESFKSPPTKSQQKAQIKPQLKEHIKCNSKEPLKSVAKETNKSQAKELTKSQVKEPAKSQPKERVKPLFREPIKSHPQRMASLDAMAKMHECNIEGVMYL